MVAGCCGYFTNNPVRELERNIERKFRDEIKLRGGMAIKLTGLAGIPDRMVLMPGGKITFVELKTSTGRKSKIQHAVQAKLIALGFDVETLYGHKDVDEWLALL